MHGDAIEPMAALGELILTLNVAYVIWVTIFDCYKKYIIRNIKRYALPVR